MSAIEIEEGDVSRTNNPKELLRLLSEESKMLVDTSAAGNEVLFALCAIKAAFDSNRINSEEFSILKSYVKTRISVPGIETVIDKLSEAERGWFECLKANDTAPLMLHERIELNKLRKQRRPDSGGRSPRSSPRASTGVPSTQPASECCICGDISNDAIVCALNHAVCNSCLTVYIHTYNESRKENASDFISKKGLVRCPMPLAISAGGCATCAEYYSNVDICRKVIDNKVLDTYIEGIKYIQRLDAFADYQYQLNEVLGKIVASDEVSGSSDIAERAMRIELQKKQYQLENLAKSLKQTFPDARQCRKCGYGPLDKMRCDNLLTHHNQIVQGEVRYNNSCPGCKAAPPQDWNELPLWNGKLPDAMLDPKFHTLVSAATVPTDSNAPYSWAEYLVQFCGVNGEVASSIGEKLAASGIVNLDDYYRQVKVDSDEVQLLAKLASLDPRLDMIMNTLSNTLDSFVSCLDAYNVRTSSFIKALVRQKEVVFRLHPSASREPLLEALTHSSESVKMFLRYSKSEPSWEQYQHLNVNKLSYDDENYLQEKQGFLVLRHDNDEAISKAHFRIRDATAAEDVCNIYVEDIAYMVHKMETSLAVTPSDNIVEDPTEGLLVASFDDLNPVVLDGLPADNCTIDVPNNIVTGFDDPEKVTFLGSVYDLRERVTAVFPCDPVTQTLAEELKSLAFANCVTSDDVDVTSGKLYLDGGCTFDITEYELTPEQVGGMARREVMVYQPFDGYKCDVVKEQVGARNNFASEEHMNSLFSSDIMELAFKTGVMCLHDDAISSIRSILSRELYVLVHNILISKEFTPADTYVITTCDVDHELRHSPLHKHVVIYGFGIQGVRYMYNAVTLKLARDFDYGRISFTVKALMVLNDLLTDFLLSVVHLAHADGEKSRVDGLVTLVDMKKAMCQRYHWDEISESVDDAVDSFHSDYYDEEREVSVHEYFNEKGETEIPVTTNRVDPNTNHIFLTNRFPGLKISVQALIAVSAAQDAILSGLLSTITDAVEHQNGLQEFNECNVEETLVITPREIYFALCSDELYTYFPSVCIRDSGFHYSLDRDIRTSIMRMHGAETNSAFDTLFNTQVEEDPAHRVIDPRDGSFYWNDSYSASPQVMQSMLFNHCSRYSKYRRMYKARMSMTPEMASMLEEEARYENCNLLHQWKWLHSKQVTHNPSFAINMAIWERIITSEVQHLTFGGRSPHHVTQDALEMIATFFECYFANILHCANQFAEGRGSVMVTAEDLTKAFLVLQV